MSKQAPDRLEVRLDAERRGKLEELAAQRQVPLSDIIRRMIDREYADYEYQRRLEAAEELGALSAGSVPEPDELSHELDGAHEPYSVR